MHIKFLNTGTNTLSQLWPNDRLIETIPRSAKHAVGNLFEVPISPPYFVSLWQYAKRSDRITYINLYGDVKNLYNLF